MSDFFQHFGQTVAFIAITAVVIGSALAATFAKSIVHASFALFFTLLGMAGYYFLLGADFLGITQVIIYVGGILVLLLFGVLLTSRSLDQLQIRSRASYIAASAVGLAVLAMLWKAIIRGPWQHVTPVVPQQTTQSLGRLLLTDYLLAFEFSSVTLLAALIGAAYIVRRREK
ncbi:MAG: NADH-quinone oxidoreductase subunit J [Candidatus Sumerlaeota bacterium]|nr:NADH-quinone oxidoreductase subunit J [Candidatus Sumerlaeota bacterium]